MESAKSRFLRYVTYYTTSDEFTGTSPSTERQKDLGRGAPIRAKVKRCKRFFCLTKGGS